MAVTLTACPSCNWEATSRLPVRVAVVRNGQGKITRDPKFLQCGRCALVFAAVRQSPAEISGYYQAFQRNEQRDYAAYPPHQDYIRNQRTYAEQLGKILDSEGVFHAGQQVLQLRCESGFHLSRLKGLATGLYGLDYFLSNVRYANEDLGLPNVTILGSELSKSPFLERQYDVVLSNHQLTHALDLKGFFDVLLQLIGRSGVVVFHGEPDHTPIIKQGWRRRVNNYHKQLLTADSALAVCRHFSLAPRLIHRFEEGLKWAIPQNSLVVIAHRV